MKATVKMEWNHPNLGRITEHVCKQHVQEILGALKSLGIGGGGEMSAVNRECERCAVGSTPIWEYLRAGRL